MRKIETFANEQELLRRIEQLKADGIMEDMMTVVGNEGTTSEALDYTEVEFKSAEGSTWDKIASWFSDDQPEDRVMEGLNLDAEEEDRYRNALDRGELLLYINNRTTEEGAYAGNDGSIEKDGFAAGASANPEDDRMQNNFDDRTRTLDDGTDLDKDSSPGQERYGTGTTAPLDMEEETRTRSTTDNRALDEDAIGRSEQFVPDAHREDPVNNQRGAYGIDERVRDDNYDYDPNFVSDEERRRHDNFGVTDEEWHNLSDEERLQLREERLRVDKEDVQTGEVNVEKHVETDHQEFDVPVERDEVTIERRNVEGDRKAGAMDNRVEDNDSIHVPVSEERVNVDKENVVDEEVVIRKNKVQDTEHVSEDVRREEVDIEETDNRDREERNRKGR